MMPLKTFEEYLNEGTVRKQSPDKHRARALVLESEDSYRILLSFLENIKLDDKIRSECLDKHKMPVRNPEHSATEVKSPLVRVSLAA